MIDALDLTVEDGEISRSRPFRGSGKSHHAFAISGLHRVDGRAHLLFGERSGPLGRRARAQVGIVFQNYAALPAHDGGAEHRLPPPGALRERGPNGIASVREIAGHGADR